MFSISSMSGTPCWRIGDVDYDLRRAFREVDPTEVITASGDVSVGGPAVGHIRVNETEAGYIIMSFIDEIGKSGLIMSIASEEPYLLTPSEEPKSDFIKEIVAAVPHWETIIKAISFLFEAPPFCAYKQLHEGSPGSTALFTFEWENDAKARHAAIKAIDRMQNEKRVCLFHMV